MAKDRVASVDYLKELLTKVSVVIASDASAGSLTLETLRAFRPVKFHYILSTYQKPLNKRYKVRVSYDQNAWRQGITTATERVWFSLLTLTPWSMPRNLQRNLMTRTECESSPAIPPGKRSRSILEHEEMLLHQCLGFGQDYQPTCSHAVDCACSRTYHWGHQPLPERSSSN
eukprot:g39688.t1